MPVRDISDQRVYLRFVQSIRGHGSDRPCAAIPLLMAVTAPESFDLSLSTITTSAPSAAMISALDGQCHLRLQ
jgi:hypothetical protein